MANDDLHDSLVHDTISVMDDSLEMQERTLLEGLLFYWNIVWRHRLLIFLLTFLGAVLTVTFSIISLKLPVDKSPLPNFYTSYTRLIIQQGTSGTGDSAAAMMEMMGFSTDSRDSLDNGSLAQLVYHSYPYADKIIENLSFTEKYEVIFDIRSTTRKIFYNYSNLSYDSRSGIMILSYESTDKYFATQVVEVMLEELQLWFLDQGGVSNRNQISTIENKLVEVSNEIERLENQIKNIQSKYGVLDIDDLSESQLTLMNSLNEQLMILDLQINQQTNTQSSYSPIETSAVKSLKSQREDVANTLYRLQNGYAVGGRVYPPVEEMPNLAIEFNKLQLLLQIQERIYLSLTEQYEVIKLAGTGSFTFTVLDPAEIPEEKSGPQRSLICIYGTFGGFFLGVGLSLLLTLISSIKAKREENFIPLDDE